MALDKLSLEQKAGYQDNDNLTWQICNVKLTPSYQLFVHQDLCMHDSFFGIFTALVVNQGAML